MEAHQLSMDRSAKIIVAIVVIVVSAFFIYSKFAGWHASKLETTVKQERKSWRDKTDQMKQEIATLKQELAVVKGQAVSQDKLAEVFGEAQQEDKKVAQQLTGKISEGKKQPSFAEVEGHIMAFFSYMDDQEYVQSYKFKEGTYHQYQIAIKKLSSKLPIITGEISSLYNIVRNVAHFYRVMGKERVLLIKQLLQNESEVIESVMRTFYLWFTMDDEGQFTVQGRPSMRNMYEYAGYILNTLGGRSYLLRRDPKVRTLTTYYCVLMLDKANDEELNSKGIDIRPYIGSSLMEIENQTGFVYQKEYLTKLSELKLKYHPN
jgi:cell division protein FtsB